MDRTSNGNENHANDDKRNSWRKQQMKLYSYFRSSASYRVRIALNLKNLPFDVVPVHLLKNGGEQFAPEYRNLNPDALVPALIDEAADNPAALTQSLAIIEYLEETHPQPALLPKNPADRAFVRSLALSIACEIHPLNNLRVLRYLVRDLKVDEESKSAWYRHWCEQGLAALEATLARDDRVGKFCFGDTPTLADCCLVPQIANAQRFNSDLSKMPTIMRINETCLALDAFQKAAPANQPDAE
jgi:maleylacetoacetate isomerase